MKKLHELLNINNPHKGDVGIEIECEGRNLKEVFEHGWRSEDDGSLRGHYPDSRIEYVLDKPIPVKNVNKYVQDLAGCLEEAKFDFSFRTSVHVHVNVQELTEAQVCNMAYTYLLLEEPLINFCGRDRKGNRFCLRVVDAEMIVSYVREMCANGVRRALGFNEQEIRYAAINLASMKKYGSIEFRSMRGNIDPDTIHIWANSLVAIREYAKSKASPQEIREEFEKNGPAKFIKKVLGQYSVYYDYPRAVKEMQRSFSLTLEIPYSYKEVAEAKNAPVADNLEHYRTRYRMKQIERVQLSRDKLVVQIDCGDGWIDWAIAAEEDRVRLAKPEEVVPARPKRPRAQPEGI